MRIFLSFLAALLAFFKALEFIYLFQIKEYRFDRIIAHLKEDGPFKVLYLTKPKLAAKSQRNIIIAVLVLVGFIKLLFLYIWYIHSTILLLLLAVLSPFIGFIHTGVSVWLTGFLAIWKRQQIVKKAQERLLSSKTEFIAITGSYGKTSTKEFLYQILSTKFRVEKTDENMNTEVGVAMSIDKNLQPDTEYFIAEAGAYRKGEIAKVCELIHPKYAILTAIGNQHMALFGARENLVTAKKELLDGLSKDGVGYINRDIPEYEHIVQHASYKVKSFSLRQSADIVVKELKSTDSLSRVKVDYNNVFFTLTVPFAGVHQVQNLLPCVALAYDLGMHVKEVEKAVAALVPLSSKLSQHKSVKGSTVLNDSYNSSVEGFLAALEVAEGMKGFSHKIIASRGILELGEEKRASYEKILATLGNTSLTLYTTDKLFKDLDEKGKVEYFISEKRMISELDKIVSPTSLLVVEGKFSTAFSSTFIKNI